MGSKVLITGSAGYLGSKVVDLLSAREGWEVYGIDVKMPDNSESYTGFIKGSVTDAAAMRDLFDCARPDVAIHLAFIVTSTHDRKLEETVDLEGTRNFLANCERLGVGKVILLSSAAAYGAHDDNNMPLTESSPIRGVSGYGYSRFKATCDLMAQEYMAAHDSCQFVLLRPCLFVGANTDNNFFDVLKFPLVPQVSDSKGVRDPLFQFIHEDDMTAVMVAAIDKPVRGVFNIAGEGTAPFTELVRRFGKRRIAMPNWILYPITRLLWRLHLVTSPPAQLDFIRYPWIMDASRMRRELYTPAKTSLEAFNEFALTHR